MQVEQVDFVSLPDAGHLAGEALLRGDARLPDRDRGSRATWSSRADQVTLDILDPSSVGEEFAPSPPASRFASPDVAAARATEAKGVEFEGEIGRHRRLSHGLLQGSGRQRADAAPPVRTEGRVNRADALEIYRSLPLAGHVHGGVALHRPARLRPRLLRPERPVRGTVPATEEPRDMLEIDVSGLATAGGGKVEIDKLPDGVEFAALLRPRAPGHADRRRRQVHGAQRGVLAERPARARAQGRGARRSALRPRRGRRAPARPSGACSWWPRKAAASR